MGMGINWFPLAPWDSRWNVNKNVAQNEIGMGLGINFMEWE